MEAVKLDYKPFPKQELFHTSRVDELLFGGAAGGGKSIALLMEAWQRGVEVPGHQSLLLRRSFPQLQKTLIRKSLEFFPSNFGRYIKNEKRWVFPNGSGIDFGYLDSDEDKYNYQGAEYDFVGFEELTQFTESMYIYLFSRIRSAKTDNNRPVMRSTCNPGGIGHNWVKARFIDGMVPGKIYKIALPQEPGEEQLYITRQFIPSKVYDNPYIVKNDPGYINRLKLLPEDERKALLDGDWNVFSGQVFKEFSRDKHTVKSFKVPDNWRKYYALDWGYAKPFAILWGAVDPANNDIYIYREYYGCKDGQVDVGIELDARRVAWNVQEIEKELIHNRVADPHCWAKQGYTGPTIAETFANEGIYMQRGVNARIQGKNQVHDRLRIDEKTGKPSLYIFENCYNLIRTLPSLPYSQTNPEDVDTKSEDHLYDALRYLLMARPISLRKKKKRKAPRTGTDRYTGY